MTEYIGIGLVLFAVGWFCITKLWFVVVLPFSTSIGWGLACLFIPFAYPIYLRTFGKSSLIYLLPYFAAVPLVIGLAVQAEFGGESYREKMKAPNNWKVKQGDPIKNDNQ